MTQKLLSIYKLKLIIETPNVYDILVFLIISDQNWKTIFGKLYGTVFLIQLWWHIINSLDCLCIRMSQNCISLMYFIGKIVLRKLGRNLKWKYVGIIGVLLVMFLFMEAFYFGWLSSEEADNKCHET